MFCVELKFVANCLFRWFNKFKPQHLEMYLGRKVEYEAKNPVNRDKYKCYICNYPVKLNAIGLNILSTKTNYTDFHVRFEHK